MLFVVFELFHFVVKLPDLGQRDLDVLALERVLRSGVNVIKLFFFVTDDKAR